MNAATAEILVRHNFDSEKVIENLRRECRRVLRVLDDEEALYSIRRGWFGAPGAASLHDLVNAVKAVMLIHTEKQEDLEEAARDALEFKAKAMALYEAIKAAPPEEQQ